MLAAFTKRAQIPFRAWLPAAIAAPTPVSALVHSSTLVTAGIYLIFRAANLFSKFLKDTILLAGLVTITIAGLRALLEKDLKKIVALSTLRQLGIIVSSLGLGLTNLAFIHLISHAFFKALLFIGVGTIIHATERYQELATITQFSSKLPITTIIVAGAKLSLCGLPFFRGFFSKDLIIERVRSALSPNFLLSILLVLGALLTQLYSLRFVFLVFSRRAKVIFLTNGAETDLTVLKAGAILLLPGLIFGNLYFFESLNSHVAFITTRNKLFVRRLFVITLGIFIYVFNSTKTTLLHSYFFLFNL